MSIKKCVNCNTLIKDNHGTRYPRCCKCWNYYRSHKPNAHWQDKEWLKQRYNSGLSLASIAKQCSVGTSTIEHWFNKFKLHARPAPSTGLTKGQLNPSWKGGRVQVHDKFGNKTYIRIYHPEPHAYRHNNYVYEHILVMEKLINRPLQKPEIVHHKNGIPYDNHPKNLQLFPNNKEHRSYEESLNSFAKEILFNNLAPHLKMELLSLLTHFLSKNG